MLNKKELEQIDAFYAEIEWVKVEVECPECGYKGEEMLEKGCE
jgi:hypothetical protein